MTFPPKKTTGADTDYMTGMELNPLDPKFNALTLSAYLTSSRITTDSEIYFN